MVEVIWSPQSKEDLQGIYDYIADDSEKYALIVIEKIIERTFIIQEFPQAGRMVPELNRIDFREVIYSNYRIIYRIMNDETVSVLTVHHGSRLFNLEV